MYLFALFYQSFIDNFDGIVLVDYSRMMLILAIIGFRQFRVTGLKTHVFFNNYFFFWKKM